MESDVRQSDLIGADNANNGTIGISPQRTRTASFRTVEDIDTCRICRGDGSDEEPLFYPCKCSGSIKFVHQDCLMEWLSHSQKKHCELCKTPFRFTKLYDPQMPRSLPTTVFIRKACIHAITAFVTWCRGVLVASVWLFWLPWSMRFVWWGLFWIADGGWIHNQRSAAGNFSQVDVFQNATTGPIRPANVTVSFTGTSASLLQVALQALFLLPAWLLQPTESLQNSSSVAVAESVIGTRALDFTMRDGSLLSAIPFFANLTPNPTINKFVVDILEGQIITLAVVVAFILVFLIREWVVQQQPIINAGNDDAEDAEEPFVDAADRVQDVIEVDPMAIPENNSQETSGNESEVQIAEPFSQQDDDGRLARLLESIEAKDSDEARSDGTSDVHHATIDHVRQLLEKMAMTNAKFSADFDINDGSILRQLASEFTNHVEQVKLSLLALQELASNALNIEDSTELEELSARSQLLYDGAKQHLPPAIASPILEPAEKTAEWIRLGASLLKSRKELEDGQQELDDLRSMYKIEIDRARKSGIPMVPGESMSNDHPLNVLRPGMPPRAKSSVAIEIQRSLEDQEAESSTTHDAAALHTVDDRSDEEPEFENLDYQGSSSRNASSDQVEAQSGELSSSEITHRAEATSERLPSDVQPVPEHPQIPEPTDEMVEDLNAPVGILEKIWDWVFAEVAAPEPQRDGGNDEHLVEDIDREAPFVPFANAEPDFHAQAHVHIADGGDEEADDVEHDGNGAFDGNDLEAIDDAEDLEGILELIGMQGPLTGLFQNCVFCAVLISATVTSGVWFPYLWGKVVLIFLANPLQLAVKAPWIIFTGLTNVALDLCLCVGGYLFCWTDALTRLLLTPLGWLIPSLAAMSKWNGLGRAIGNMAGEAFKRLVASFIRSSEATVPDFYHLSLNAHFALETIRAKLRLLMGFISFAIRAAYWIATTKQSGIFSPISIFRYTTRLLGKTSLNPQSIAKYLALAMDILKSNAANHVLEKMMAKPTIQEVAAMPWTAWDRIIATVTGYTFFAVVGTVYLKAGAPFTTSERGKKIEGIITDMLQQAGGVLKVILIISIEMLLFPLYCGLLLDIATLPLFENASLQSRISMTMRSPWTSGFVHWFVGTCYMFHFALFVSMCRKIVRNGVLYFIRDPDDPTFHPVRDVLERSISSQLKKIGFSAMVYGGLVIFCMGSVVWTVAYTFHDIFPIRWSSDTPVLEFPIDLLLYNTVAPLAMHLLRPSKVLHRVYDEELRKCARVLRLSDFLFGTQSDEEEKRQTAEDGTIKVNGRFVRTPASDQVRIPKGQSVFIEVDANNKRLDVQDGEGAQAGKDEGNEHFTKVFVPPHFRLRVALFVLWVWGLTALAGLAFTVGPVVVGRGLLGSLAEPGTEINDIYTFFVGTCAFIVLFYTGASYKSALGFVKSNFRTSAQSWSTALASTSATTIQALRVIYLYGSLTLLLPSLVALVLEFYFIMPLHAYLTLRQQQQLRTTTGNSTPNIPQIEDHTMHFLQDWTLGLLYIRIVIRMCLSRPNSRPARALRAIVEPGWLNPNVALATRCFILPCTVLAVCALVLPGLLGTLWALIGQIQFYPSPLAHLPETLHPVNLVRFTYPALALSAILFWAAGFIARAIGSWECRIRDEVYLIGERLHNFGESHPPPHSTATAMTIRS